MTAKWDYSKKVFSRASKDPLCMTGGLIGRLQYVAAHLGPFLIQQGS